MLFCFLRKISSKYSSRAAEIAGPGFRMSRVVPIVHVVLTTQGKTKIDAFYTPYRENLPAFVKHGLYSH